jgi:FG-GAP-like repeat
MNQPASRSRFAAAALAAATLFPFTGCVSSEPTNQGWNTEAAVVADLDGNLIPDVLSASSAWDQTGNLPGYLTVRLQSATARGTFADPIRTSTCGDPEALAVGDVDGDGRLDVAVACGVTAGTGFEVAVHLQSTSQPGSFKAPTLLSTGAKQPSAIRLADLDGDGRLDLIVGVRSGTTLLLFFQQPAPAVAGTFASPVTLEVGAAPVAVAAGDLTGAGRLDLVVTTADGRVVVLLHNVAPGSFLPGLSYPAGLYPVAVEIADLDGDGNPDLLMADASGSLLVMTQQGGGGAFDPVVAHDVHDWDTRALSVADLDGDGRLDVVVASAGPPGLPGSVAVFKQAPAPALPGTLLPPCLYTGYQGPLSIVVADVDGDTRPDLVIADGLASIRYQDPTGRFLPPVWLRQ